MATSGSLNSSAYQGRYLQLTWTATQDVVKNQSTISWTLKGAGTSTESVSWYMAGGFHVKIDGVTVYTTSKNTRIKLYNGTTISSGTKVIDHNYDGTKSFNIYIDGCIYTYDVNVNASGAYTLTTIPRASTISVGQLTMGTAGTITVTRGSSSFTHTIKYQWGDCSPTGIAEGAGYTGTICTKSSSTSISWTPPYDLANVIPNTDTGVGSLICDTYNGSSLIGSSYIKFVCKVPNNSYTRPTVSLVYGEAVDDVRTKIGCYIQNLSKLNITATCNGYYNATIAQCNIYVNDEHYTDTTITTAPLRSSGDMIIRAYIIDSRGYTNEMTVTINVKAYVKPRINSFTAQRSDSSGTVSDEGTSLKAYYNVAATSITGPNGSNTRVTKLKYKRSDQTSYTSVTVSGPSGTKIIADILNLDYNYDILLSVTDKFNTTESVIQVGTAFTLIDFNASGKGIGIGKVSQGDNLDCNLDATFRGGFNANLSGLLMVKTFIYETTKSLEAGKTLNTFWTVTQEGYTPLGVVGFHTSHSGLAALVARMENTTQAKLTIRNVTSSAINVVGQKVEVLFLKTTL